MNWDSGYYFHPDERSIYMRVDCMYKVLLNSLGYLDCIKAPPFELTEPGLPSIQTFFSSDKSPLNPHWFPLGSAIIYLLLIFKMLLSPFISLGVYDLYLIGRPLSIIADIGSMVFIYIIAKNRNFLKVGFAIPVMTKKNEHKFIDLFNPQSILNCKSC